MPDSVYHAFQQYGKAPSPMAEDLIRIGHCSCGLLYLLVFLCDPIVRRAIHTARAPRAGTEEEISLDGESCDFFASFLQKDQPSSDAHRIAKLMAQHI